MNWKDHPEDYSPEDYQALLDFEVVWRADQAADLAAEPAGGVRPDLAQAQADAQFALQEAEAAALDLLLDSTKESTNG